MQPVTGFLPDTAAPNRSLTPEVNTRPRNPQITSQMIYLIAPPLIIAAGTAILLRLAATRVKPLSEVDLVTWAWKNECLYAGLTYGAGLGPDLWYFQDCCADLSTYHKTFSVPMNATLIELDLYLAGFRTEPVPQIRRN